MIQHSILWLQSNRLLICIAAIFYLNLIASNLLGQITIKADSLLENGFYSEAIDEYERIINKKKGIALLDLGNSYLRQGKAYYLNTETDRALAQCFNALAIFDTLNNIERLAATTSNIGYIYSDMGDFLNAVKYYKSSYQYSLAANDSLKLNSILNDLANLHFEFGEIRESIDLHFKALENYKNILSSKDEFDHLVNIAVCYKKLNTDSANIYLSLAESIAIKEKDSASLAIVFNNLGNLNRELGNLQQSVSYLRNAFEIFENHKDTLNSMIVAYNMAETYEFLKLYTESSLYYKKALELSNAIYNDKRLTIASELSEKYESDKKDEKIRTQEIENRLKSRNLWLSSGGLVLVAALTVVSFISYQRKQKANQLLTAQNDHIEKLNKELDASNQVKTKLFSVISHDLRGPVSSLYAYLQLKSNDSDKANKVIIEQTEQLLEDLEDLLVWSKSQLHQFVPFQQDIYLYDLCNDVPSLLYTSMLQKNNRIVNHIRPALMIRSDLNILTIVLRNILSNAIKYAVPASAIEVNAKMEPKQVIITVSNETNSENLQRLYALQDETVTSDRSGLGITLVKEFMTKLRGQFAYTTKQNWVTAMITLPLPDQPISPAGA